MLSDIPLLERMTPEQKASMKKPGFNQWNDFQKVMGGEGYSSDQIKHMYNRYKEELERRQRGESSEETEYEKVLRKKRGKAGDDVPTPTPAYSGPQSSSDTVNKPFIRYPAATVDLNQCAKKDLMNLPNVSDKVASNIVEFREALKRQGKRFEDIKDLNKVNQIGKVTFDKIKTHFYITPPRQ